MRTLLRLLAMSMICYACKTDKLETLGQIDGTWRVTSVATEASGRPDSLLTPFNLSLSFDPCTSKDNKGTSSCTMRVFQGGVSYEFFYQITDGKTLILTPVEAETVKPAYPALSNRLEGPYEIIELQAGSLWIKKERNCDQIGNLSSCERVNLKAIR